MEPTDDETRPEPAFAGETVLITGTARGSAAPVRFASPSAARRWSAATADQIGDGGGDLYGSPPAFEPVAADVTDPEAVEALVERAADTGRVDDAVVNVAGIVAREPPLATHDGEPWERSVAVNLTAPFRIAREAAPHLRKTGGAVVNISSIYGQIGANARGAGAVDDEGRDRGVNARARRRTRGGRGPSQRRRAGIHRDADDRPSRTPRTMRRASGFGSSPPLERLGGPGEVASVVTFLASDDALVRHGRDGPRRRRASHRGSESVGGRRRSTGGGDYGPF